MNNEIIINEDCVTINTYANNRVSTVTFEDCFARMNNAANTIDIYTFNSGIGDGGEHHKISSLPYNEYRVYIEFGNIAKQDIILQGTVSI